ncbi:MAG: queuosine precursor transporter [Chloroflexi bacterium]|nr:queuosine precursor transporter [Chloroflexota bacterium]
MSVSVVNSQEPIQLKAVGPIAQSMPIIALVVVAAYIAAQMVADVASLRIGNVAGLAVDMGTFIYPITFTLRDVVHKIWGKRNAQALIITAAVINVLMVLYLGWAASVASDPVADPDGLFGAAYALVFGPLWRIVLASILAEVVSEMADTEAYHWFVTRITQQKQWARVLVSNAVSIPIDTAIFAVVAFGGVFPWTAVGQIFLFNLIVKFAVTLFSLPLIYVYPDPDWSQLH